MSRLSDGFLKAVGGAKSWTAEKHQSEVLVKQKKTQPCKSQSEKNMSDLFSVFFLATPLFITRNFLAAWVIPAQSYRFSAESEQSKGRNNKLCVALHPGVLIT